MLDKMTPTFIKNYNEFNEDRIRLEDRMIVTTIDNAKYEIKINAKGEYLYFKL